MMVSQVCRAQARPPPSGTPAAAARAAPAGGPGGTPQAWAGPAASTITTAQADAMGGFVTGPLGICSRSEQLVKVPRPPPPGPGPRKPPANRRGPEPSGSGTDTHGNNEAGLSGWVWPPGAADKKDEDSND